MVKRATHKPSDQDSLLAVQLERARRRLIDRAMARFHEAGFSDLRLTHYAVMAYLPARGARVTTLARRSRVTKQSMSELVLDLERLGYVERREDPTDRRAKVVAFTKRGVVANQAGIAALRAGEAQWGREIGSARMKELRAILEELVGDAE